MSRVPLHYIDLRTFSYATEDDKRVEEALRSFLPEDFELDRTENVGHHGDRIVVFSVRVENADDMRHVLDRLGDIEEADRVIREMDERVDENTSLFLRLDKQAAFNGLVRLGHGITLRGKVEAYPAKKDAAVENARELLADAADLDAESLEIVDED